MSRKLAGRRVLIVEDQYLIADDLRRLLTEAGAEVLGPSPSLGQAMVTIENTPPDFALLDVNLGDEDAYPVARELQRRGTPFAFVTGYSHSTIPAEFSWAPHIEKPFEADAIVEAMEKSLSRSH